jgi:signal transduction histidine kinase
MSRKTPTRLERQLNRKIYASAAVVILLVIVLHIPVQLLLVNNRVKSREAFMLDVVRHRHNVIAAELFLKKHFALKMRAEEMEVLFGPEERVDIMITGNESREIAMPATRHHLFSHDPIRGMLSLQHRLLINGEDIGRIRIDIHDVSLSLFGYWPLLASLIGVSLFALVVASILVRKTVRKKILRPLHQIVVALRDVQTPRDFDVRMTIHEDNEIGELATHVSDMFRRLTTAEEHHERDRHLVAVGHVASQVAHDIRSPLTALRVVAGHLAELPEEKRVMIRSAVQRIEDIAFDLSERHRGHLLEPIRGEQKKSAVPQLLSSLIEPLIFETRIQYRKHLDMRIESHLDARSYGLFAMIQPIEFKRVLSNLINNGVEAVHGAGEVSVSMVSRENKIVIQIHDAGHGIPAEVLPRLMQRGVSFGKTTGSGLGLYHARTTVEAWGGTLKLDSVVGKGTSVIMVLPQVSPPPWFVQTLEIPAGCTVVIVDDDASIHHVWEERFVALPMAEHNITTKHFSSSAAVTEWHHRHGHDDAIFLCDYELLNEDENGLDLIARLHIPHRTLLVTSRYEEDDIRARCAALGVKLIPKGLSAFVPITIGNTSTAQDLLCDCVLIDDDLLVHRVWSLQAKHVGKLVQTYVSGEMFYAAARQIDKTTPVYVDVKLGGQENGVDVAKQVYEMGFRDIFFTTGYTKDDVPDIPWIKGLVGKEPPWTI